MVSTTNSAVISGSEARCRVPLPNDIGGNFSRLASVPDGGRPIRRPPLFYSNSKPI